MTHDPINPRAEVSDLLPWHIRNKLVAAARAKNHREIDALTDTLAGLGLVRQRSDASMFAPRPRIGDAYR